MLLNYFFSVSCSLFHFKSLKWIIFQLSNSSFIVVNLKCQVTCQGIPPNTSNSIPSIHSPRSSFFTCPIQSFGVRLCWNDTAGCSMENGAAITKPSRMHSNCRASVHATEYNPPKTVYLKVLYVIFRFSRLASNSVAQAT